MRFKFSFIFFLLLFLVHCKVQKNDKNKSETGTNSSLKEVPKNTAQNTTVTPAAGPAPFFPMPVFNYTPTILHVDGFKNKYPQIDSISLKTLEMGHQLYNYGVCIKCHIAKDLFAFDDLKWARIIPDMSMRAHISEKEKDALVKYIMAIKSVPLNNNK